MAVVSPCFLPDPTWRRSPGRGSPATQPERWGAAQRGSSGAVRSSSIPSILITRPLGLRGSGAYWGFLKDTNVEERRGRIPPSSQRGQLRSDRSNFPLLISDRDPTRAGQRASRGGARPRSSNHCSVQKRCGSESTEPGSSAL